MFIDFVTILLIAASISLFTIALYLVKGLGNDSGHQKWGPAFILPGVIQIFFGCYMTLTWPLPGPYNMAYGESSVMLGILMVTAGILLIKECSLLPLSIPAFFFGAVAVVLGMGIKAHNLTQEPLLTAIGFVTAGMGGLFAWVPLIAPQRRLYRSVGAGVMIVSALIWVFTAYMAYWMHLSGLAKYLPSTMVK